MLLIKVEQACPFNAAGMTILDPLMPIQAPNFWVPNPPAISFEERAASASPQPPRMRSPAGRAAAQISAASSLQQSAGVSEQLAAPSMVDASLLLGQSFRSGWGPHCTFVQPCTLLAPKACLLHFSMISDHFLMRHVECNSHVPGMNMLVHNTKWQ